MSCDWYVHCLDCKSTQYFDDSNHEKDAMLVLCKHAATIASLLEFRADMKRAAILGEWGLSFGGRHTIDVEWFAAHGSHRLVPIDEYGRTLNQCHDYVRCPCGATHHCIKTIGHEGAHQ